jgi:secreted trypsin-like serine protease|uniref:Peptidase S1 domain-containing protein n=1 Tax=Panagrolaimus sp. PS1159 TaxID=55785 RepID=A0AC35FDW6_9BILA
MLFKSFLLLFFLFSFGISKAEESDCGISPSLERYKEYNQNRIFGGENSNEGDFPWYIWMYADGGKGCSGTIIHENWILTAAHCVNEAEHVTIYYGSVDWKIMKTQKTAALQYFVHPQYGASGHASNDIALIKLNGTLEFSDKVQPICLDSNVDSPLNEILTQCGMGSDFKKRNGSNTHFSHDILQDAPIQHINSSICGKNGKEEYICVGGVNHAALPGDSGGPLMAIRDERWVQIGVASTYSASNYEGESISINVKNTYINVSSYCKWIKEITENVVQC